MSFVVIHLAPGDPTTIVTSDLPIDQQEALKQLIKLYGLDQPLYLQYWNWLKRIVFLDFGRSFAPHGRPVLQMIRERLPITLALNIIEMLIIVAMAVPIGVTSATRQYSTFDKSTTVFVFVGFATPEDRKSTRLNSSH